jgi:hypothetical protein
VTYEQYQSTCVDVLLLNQTAFAKRCHLIVSHIAGSISLLCSTIANRRFEMKKLTLYFRTGSNSRLWLLWCDTLEFFEPRAPYTLRPVRMQYEQGVIDAIAQSRKGQRPSAAKLTTLASPLRSGRTRKRAADSKQPPPRAKSVVVRSHFPCSVHKLHTYFVGLLSLMADHASHNPTCRHVGGRWVSGQSRSDSHFVSHHHGPEPEHHHSDRSAAQCARAPARAFVR